MIIHDSKYTINISDLKLLYKEDHHYNYYTLPSKTVYWLRINYGSKDDMVMIYESKEECEKMYNEIIKQLKLRNLLNYIEI